jgi:hypothetical protein
MTEFTNGEGYLATVARLFAAEGDVLAVELLSKASPRFEWYSHDNWDGGFDMFNLYLDVSLPLYSRLGERRESLEKAILDKLQAITQTHTADHVSNVLIALEVIATPDWRKRAQAWANKGSNPEETATGPLPSIVCRPEVFRRPDKETNDEQVGIMMPFSTDFKPTYDAIRRACLPLGLHAIRADDIWEDTTFMQDIFGLIYCSRVIVVDFSNKNPNVMYETGIAHTLGKQVIPIARSLDDVPSDLRHHRALLYLPNAEGLAALETALAIRLSTITGREPRERTTTADTGPAANT